MTIKLEVFTSQSCPYCPMAIDAAEKAVEELGDVIEFEHLDVNENMSKVRELQIMSVPTVVIDNEVAYVGAPEAAELIATLKSKL
ncbi:thioredoxin family protein [Methanosphaera sp. WGK6]|uniref:thioredoxin family protein n=1 Tax=Methanosphaera sp. WGK6 TaxID=1561964 RepID=UPI00084C6A2F|nr:thioredoxin family protein [Methanosphaera sp. WGK6]OED30883.1 thioredoxin [Methanosphaera sp. WGK6]